MRSLLFVPGDSDRKLAKGLDTGADALILDLEDSVAAEAKPRAREIVASFLAEMVPLSARPRLFVRVNAFGTNLTDADLDAAVAAAPDGIMLPKATGGADVGRLAAKLAVREARAGLPDGSIAILAIATETAASLFGLGSYGNASPRLAGLAWGAEDLSADLGAETYRDGSALTDPFRLARTLTLLGAPAAGVAAIDAIFADIRDLDGLADECRAASRDGFTAKMAIHPAQIPVINAAFTPSAEAVAKARAIVQAFADAPGAGVLTLDGMMIDRPHLLRAERLLARAEAIKAQVSPDSG
ncbi:HpcH/HpaI aldolase/citrate lyase family protein [Chelatococcus sp. GCM10030263]|uniref:HpcH/HpaI aldolase/citrate lyase family protein n=1 Tax=Chelatococcus sp. GCM10030263 TaxID=3273387 RepID=UPI0036122FD6